MDPPIPREKLSKNAGMVSWPMFSTGFYGEDQTSPKVSQILMWKGGGEVSCGEAGGAGC